MKDLELKIRGPVVRIGQNTFDISNIFAFELYLYCLKMCVDNFIKTQTKIKEFDMITDQEKDTELIRRFEYLEKLTVKSNINKYYCGKSTGLADLVEHLFTIKLDNKDNACNAINGSILERILVIENFGDLLLNCLSNSLIYHVDVDIMKRYIKIIVNQAYSIRESDEICCNYDINDASMKNFLNKYTGFTENTPKGAIFLEKYLKIFENILNGDSKDNTKFNPSYFTINTSNDRSSPNLLNCMKVNMANINKELIENKSDKNTIIKIASNKIDLSNAINHQARKACAMCDITNFIEKSIQ